MLLNVYRTTLERIHSSSPETQSFSPRLYMCGSRHMLLLPSLLGLLGLITAGSSLLAHHHCWGGSAERTLSYKSLASYLYSRCFTR